MCGPAGMCNTNVIVECLLRVGESLLFCKFIQSSNITLHLEDLWFLIGVVHCKPCRVISSVLKPAESINECLTQELPAARSAIVEVPKDATHCDR